MNTYFGRLAGALLCASAGLVLSAGCAQNEGATSGRQASASSSGGSQDRISAPPPNPSRGGGSPAVRASASGRPDGGTDVRAIGQGNAQYTLAYPTGDRNTSIVLLEAAGPQQVPRGPALQLPAPRDQPDRHAAAQRARPRPEQQRRV